MGHLIVVIDRGPARLTGIEHAHIVGDVTGDQVLHEGAGVG
jgi:hypothetical protein